MPFNRRQILASSLAAGGALTTRTLLAGGALGTVAAVAGSRAASAAEPFTQPLPIPPVLTDDEIVLTAAETQVQILEGPPTTMWTFNGTFPGPTIRRPAGHPTKVTVRHRLPESVGTITVHHHGAHVASEDDGGPIQDPVPVGGERDYLYELFEDGGAERGAMQWYHDHTHHRSGRNVWMGLMGLFIIDEPELDAELGLPTGDFDVPLVIANRNFDADNQLVSNFTAVDREEATILDATSGYPPFDERPAPVHLVNGAAQPMMAVQARRYRFRVLNASNFNPYNLRLDGQPLVQVATESGLIPQALTRPTIMLGPGERAEFVVDFTGLEGQELFLASVASRSNTPLPATGAVNSDLVKFVVGPVDPEDPDTTAPTLGALRPLPEWVAELPTTPDRVWVFGLGTDPGGKPAWTINGQVFDHERVDARPELDSAETWLLVNATPFGTSHYIHIHDVDWKLLERNGAAPPPGEDALKETFRLDPGEYILVGSKFTDHVGPYMIHCHMLEHEDHGMMTTWEVVEPGASTDPGRPASLQALLERSLPDDERALTAAILRHATAGRPAPESVLRALHTGPSTLPTGLPSVNQPWCQLQR